MPEVGVDEWKAELQPVGIAPAQERRFAAEAHRVNRPPRTATKVVTLDAKTVSRPTQPELDRAIAGRRREGGALQAWRAVGTRLHDRGGRR